MKHKHNPDSDSLLPLVAVAGDAAWFFLLGPGKGLLSNLSAMTGIGCMLASDWNLPCDAVPVASRPGWVPSGQSAGTSPGYGGCNVISNRQNTVMLPAQVFYSAASGAYYCGPTGSAWPLAPGAVPSSGTVAPGTSAGVPLPLGASYAVLQGLVDSGLSGFRSWAV